MSTANIKTTLISESKISNVDFKNLKFGGIFTDYMFECTHKNGKWGVPEIKPYAPLTIDPSARVFHYGQAVFEGMKAYKDDNDDVFLFRPDENFKRINKSAERLAMPTFPEKYFFEGLTQLLKLDKDWIQKGLGNSLYIRPFMIATEHSLSASPSNEYKFMIICSPVKAYYSGVDVKVLIADKYSRSANGGVGFAKAAGNYAGQFYPTDLANKEGYQQVIWTDSDTHQYLEEAGTMNLFFRINDTLITAPISDRILDGVTRKSIIQLAKDNNIDVDVRQITVNEVKEAAKKGELKEVFGSGTAAVISPITGFKHLDEVFDLPNLEDSYASFLKEQLTGIQYNKIKDSHNWVVKI